MQYCTMRQGIDSVGLGGSFNTAYETLSPVSWCTVASCGLTFSYFGRFPILKSSTQFNPLPPSVLIWWQRVEIWILYEEGSDEKISYERRDYAAVAGKQQFSIARTKLPPLVIAGGKGLIKYIVFDTLLMCDKISNSVLYSHKASSAEIGKQRLNLK